jgi:hypothetical protein
MYKIIIYKDSKRWTGHYEENSDLNINDETYETVEVEKLPELVGGMYLPDFVYKNGELHYKPASIKKEQK